MLSTFNNTRFALFPEILQLLKYLQLSTDQNAESLSETPALRPSQHLLSESFQTSHLKLLLTPAAESDHDIDTTKIVKMTTVTLTSSDGVDITVGKLSHPYMAFVSGSREMNALHLHFYFTFDSILIMSASL